MSSKLNYCVEASGQHRQGSYQTIEEENINSLLLGKRGLCVCYAWPHSSMICCLPYMLWLTVFLSCIQYVGFFKYFSAFL